MSLFDECIEALGSDTNIKSESETIEIFKDFRTMFPITNWGVVDWGRVQNKYEVKKLNEILNIIRKRKINKDKSIFILWDDATLPSIKANLETTLRVIDDVTAVSFDTWVFNPYDKYIIEFHHEGRITIGFV